MTLEKTTSSTLRLALGATALTLMAGTASADIVHPDDVIIQGSACVGFDCVNGESFGFDTLRLKENNLRIKFDDTSNSASFPRNKWELTANETTNGGAEKFSITDVTNSRIPFTIRGTAPNNSIFVATSGNVGLKTGSPVVELHIADGDTPTIRLEQNGTSGFTPQTWDMAGNETNYFIRDVSNGSLLPFRIRPSAPTSSIDIASDGDVGMGVQNPLAALHVKRSNGTAQVLVEEASGTFNNTRIQLQLQNNGSAQMALVDSNNSTDWRLQNLNDKMRFTKAGTGQAEMELDNAGNLTTLGTVNGVSDKNRKMAIQEIDPGEILAKVVAMPVSSWTYKHEAATGVRHIGPMAQDFYALFGTGSNDKVISLMDASGVALAAIQALTAENDAQKTLIADLAARLERLESRAAE